MTDVADCHSATLPAPSPHINLLWYPALAVEPPPSVSGGARCSKRARQQDDDYPHLQDCSGAPWDVLCSGSSCATAYSESRESPLQLLESRVPPAGLGPAHVVQPLAAKRRRLQQQPQQEQSRRTAPSQRGHAWSEPSCQQPSWGLDLLKTQAPGPQEPRAAAQRPPQPQTALSCSRLLQLVLAAGGSRMHATSQGLCPVAGSQQQHQQQRLYPPSTLPQQAAVHLQAEQRRRQQQQQHGMCASSPLLALGQEQWQGALLLMGGAAPAHPALPAACSQGLLALPQQQPRPPGAPVLRWAPPTQVHPWQNAHLQQLWQQHVLSRLAQPAPGVQLRSCSQQDRMLAWAGALGLQRLESVHLALHLWRRVSLLVSQEQLLLMGALQGTDAASLACLWTAAKLEECRRGLPAASRVGALVAVTGRTMGAVELYLMQLVQWAPLRGWRSP